MHVLSLHRFRFAVFTARSEPGDACLMLIVAVAVVNENRVCVC